jgi:hypothetical protein
MPAPPRRPGGSSTLVVSFVHTRYRVEYSDRAGVKTLSESRDVSVMIRDVRSIHTCTLRVASIVAAAMAQPIDPTVHRSLSIWVGPFHGSPPIVLRYELVMGARGLINAQVPAGTADPARTAYVVQQRMRQILAAALKRAAIVRPLSRPLRARKQPHLQHALAHAGAHVRVRSHAHPERMRQRAARAQLHGA